MNYHRVVEANTKEEFEKAMDKEVKAIAKKKHRVMATKFAVISYEVFGLQAIGYTALLIVNDEPHPHKKI